MKLLDLKSSIKAKLSFRFGVLILIFMGCVGYTFTTLNMTISINNEINTVFNPSVKQVQDMKLMLSNSKSLISNWIFVQSDSANIEKKKLNKLMATEFPAAKIALKKIAVSWSKEDQKGLDSVFNEVDGLFMEYNNVKSTLSTFESYSDPMLVLTIYPVMAEQGSITLKFNQIIKDLDKIAKSQVENSQDATLRLTSLLGTFKVVIIVIALFTILLGIFITITTVRGIILPINEVKSVLSKMGQGEISEEKLSVGDDELGKMSEALNYLSDGLKETAAYADKIGNGDFNAVYTPLSEKDLLGNSLLQMGKKLKVLGEEDRKRNWVTAGLAQFADILRSSSDVVELSNEIITNLVKYMGANQGGIFLVKEHGNEKVLELKSCYAYERKKYLEKIVKEGEGLLGQCLLERDTIYLTEVPNNYINITSGIGGANPKCIIIQPLVVNDEMVGVIELASFKIMDKFELEFLKKLSENIAGVILNVKINERTVQLLDEARSAQESMRSQEEELRQNLEELTATQEEMFRKEKEYLDKIAQLELKSV